MSKKTILSALILVSFVLAACGAAGSNTAPMEEPLPMGVALERVADMDEAASPSDGRSFGGDAAQIEPLVIRTANLSLVVEDPAASADEIGKMAEEMGGFVVFSNVFQTSFDSTSNVVTRASVTIRVPSERLDEALDQIEEGAIEVQNRSVQGEDVTQQYTDLQSRLRNLEVAEEQLRQIMEDAIETEDVLQVFENLRQVREQIELLRGFRKTFISFNRVNPRCARSAASDWRMASRRYRERSTGNPDPNTSDNCRRRHLGANLCSTHWIATRSTWIFRSSLVPAETEAGED
jgi:hypothetical protein